jgi:hypothetical protein
LLVHTPDVTLLGIETAANKSVAVHTHRIEPGWFSVAPEQRAAHVNTAFEYAGFGRLNEVCDLPPVRETGNVNPALVDSVVMIDGSRGNDCLDHPLLDRR